MRRRPLCVLCCCFILLTMVLTVSGLPLPWQEQIPEELAKTLENGADGKLYGQLYRVQTDSAGCTLYIKNTILLVHSNQYFLNNSKISYDERPKVHIGDSLCVSGRVSLPQRAGNPGQFDGAAYYRVRHISVLVRAFALQVTKEEPAWLPELAGKLQTCMAEQIDRVLAPAEAGVLKTMLLGEKSGLEEDVRQLYQKNGISHILAISGIHISLLGMGLYRLLRKGLSIPGATLLSGGFLFFYLILTGFPVSAQRAVFMFWLRRGAEWAGRTYDEPTALSLAAMILLCENPLYMYDSSFRLSFGAALFIWLLKRLGVEGRSFYLYFWLCMLPLTMYYYYEISFVSIVLNLLVLPPLGAVLFLGLTGGLAGMALPWLGTLLLFPAGCILKLYAWLCGVASRIPFSSLVTGRPLAWQLVLYGAGLLGILLFRRRCKRKYLPIYAGASVLLALLLIFRLPGSLSVTMLDVGQGDCLVIQKGSSAVLVDGGSTTVQKVGQYRIAPYLRYMGIRHIGSILLTHPDEDHMNGLGELLQMVKEGELSLTVECLVVPVWLKESQDWAGLRREAEYLGIPVVYAKAGDRYTFKGASFTVLYPDRETQPASANAGSLTFMLEVQDFSMLFTGDLEGEGETALLEKAISCDVLKVAHHGSAYSTSALFLDGASPRAALISCGAGNRYGHPSPETLERLTEKRAKIYCTMDRGAVRILPGKEKFAVWTFRPKEEENGA